MNSHGGMYSSITARRAFHKDIDKKHWDSADWAQGAEDFSLSPKYHFPQPDPSQLTAKKHLQRGRKFFDSAEWVMSGMDAKCQLEPKKEVLAPAHPSTSSLQPQEFTETVEEVFPSPKLAKKTLNRKGKKFFDSADWEICINEKESNEILNLPKKNVLKRQE